MEDQKNRKLKEMINISEAAEYIGVAGNTLRNWERAGKIPVYRSPLNKYRYYRKEDLDAVLLSVSESKESPLVLYEHKCAVNMDSLREQYWDLLVAIRKDAAEILDVYQQKIYPYYHEDDDTEIMSFMNLKPSLIMDRVDYILSGHTKSNAGIIDIKLTKLLDADTYPFFREAEQSDECRNADKAE